MRRVLLVTATIGGLACLLACARFSAKSDAGATSTTASASASVSLADGAAPDAGHADIELIWGAGLWVGVSSMVDNDRDLPEHIADHDAGTAWNGRTGDLVGGWFGARLGQDKYVHYVTFTVGFDKKTATEDLFTANYRITRVRVDCVPVGGTHDPQTLREVDLDPEVRTPQRVMVDAFCWDLKLVVTGVKPGTHQGWGELAVSELAVYGWEKPPDTPQIPYYRKPIFNVGTHYTTPTKASLYRGATYEEACAKVIADEDDDMKPLRCDAPESTEPGRGAILETARIPYSTKRFRGELVAFKTASGVVIAYVHVTGRDSDASSQTDYRLKSQTWSGNAVVIDIAETDTVTAPMESHVVCHPASTPWCTVTTHRVDD